MSRDECHKKIVICYVLLFVSLIFGYDFFLLHICMIENEIFGQWMGLHTFHLHLFLAYEFANIVHDAAHFVYIVYFIFMQSANVIFCAENIIHCSHHIKQKRAQKMTIHGNEHLFMTNPCVLYIALSQAGLGSPYLNQLVLRYFHRTHIFHPSIVILKFFSMHRIIVLLVFFLSDR